MLEFYPKTSTEKKRRVIAAQTFKFRAKIERKLSKIAARTCQVIRLKIAGKLSQRKIEEERFAVSKSDLLVKPPKSADWSANLA
jgi:hypothetical protein